jgi:hypothetical protein
MPVASAESLSVVANDWSGVVSTFNGPFGSSSDWIVADQDSSDTLASTTVSLRVLRIPR